MSEAKFVVGQWVTVHDGSVCQLISINEGKARTNESPNRWIGTNLIKPFLWQVGKTYKTTLDGVTAKVYKIVADGGGCELLANCPWRRDSIIAQSFHGETGRLWNYESDGDVPHLLPYLVDEPPPVVDAATYSEFAEADECADVNHPAHYTQHPSGVECVDIAEAFNFNIGNAIKYLWRAGLKGDALEDLRKAAWYVQREIERAKR